MNIPNSLTVFRLSLVPIFVVVFYMPRPWHAEVSAGIFALAALTDWLDGYLARKLQQLSALGEFLDPVADKLLVAVALVLLVQCYATPLLAVSAAVIVGREIVISALREWMAELGKRKSVMVSQIGKWKTALQMLAIIFLLAGAKFHQGIIAQIGQGLLILASILTLYSMIVYLKIALHDLSLKS